ncbi:LppP/LprE family lipoprotein [Streptomyces macrosporus]|uniref:LppP/LprE family lipoprotein n=1 Tax=Streptomyces macrosporus TaxID=44032 RepID=UPI0031DCE4D4
MATATAVVLVASALAGCDSGGVRIEASGAPATDVPAPGASPLPASPPSASPPDGSETGPAPRVPPPSSLPSRAGPVYPPGTEGELDVLALLREDPKIGENVKKVLRPCTTEVWPVDVSYGRLTGGHAPDVLVNVSDCNDGMGVGSYVYRQSTNGQYVGVFASEEPPVHAEAVDDRLRVVQQVYLDGDPVCCPSGRDVVTYAWRDDRFTAVERELQEPDAPEASKAPGTSDGGDGAGADEGG